MDRNLPQTYKNLRALLLTTLLAVLAIFAAMDLAYLTHTVGHFALMIALGVLAVIRMTCDKTVFVLNAAALL
ncbi:MAG: hypothetical protein IKM00_05505, partial [Clostridia bacterium]|nr:hypothetical protein [Clostridia bacterium]